MSLVHVERALAQVAACVFECAHALVADEFEPRRLVDQSQDEGSVRQVESSQDQALRFEDLHGPKRGGIHGQDASRCATRREAAARMAYCGNTGELRTGDSDASIVGSGIVVAGESAGSSSVGAGTGSSACPAPRIVTFRRAIAAQDDEQHASIGVAAFCVSLLCAGRYLAEADDGEARRPMPCSVNRCTTLAARADDSSQFDGNARVLIGTIVGVPSTRIGFGNGFSVAASRRKTLIASGDSVATPLGNRMSVRISTSTHSPWRRTTMRSSSISRPSPARLPPRPLRAARIACLALLRLGIVGSARAHGAIRAASPAH